MPLAIVEGAYLGDILDQAAALRRTARGLRCPPELLRLAGRLASAGVRRIVLTGMGSSLYALYPLFLRLTGAGISCLWVETAELVHSVAAALNAETAVVAVSQSGRTVEILRLLDVIKDRSPVVGVTNDAGSPLASRAAAPVLLHAGPESAVSCKTYLASLLALEWLGHVLRGLDPAPLEEQFETAAVSVDAYLSAWRAHASAFAAGLAGVAQVFVAGRGDSIATAETGGLILKESAHVPSEGMSCAALRHGPWEMLRPDVSVMIMEGSGSLAALNRRLYSDVLAAGARAVFVGEHGSAPETTLHPKAPAMLPLLEILPVQMASLALAALRGREAGRFERASKVTTVE